MGEPTESRDGRSQAGDARTARDRLKSLGVMLLELLVGVPLALAFFLLLLVMLNAIFPDATGIGELVRQREGFGDLGVSDTSLKFEDDPGEAALAVLSEVHRNVRAKPAASVTWSPARVGQPLEDRSAVQSAARSSASIAFDASNELSLGERSLVVIRKPKPRFGSRRSRASVLFVDGTMRAKLGGSSDGGTLDVEVVTAAGSVRPAADGKPIEVQLVASHNGPTTLSVYDGDAEVRWGDTTTIVPANHGLILDVSQPPGLPRRLPARPSPVSPADGAVFTYRAATSRIPLIWQPADDTAEFGVAIARDPAFEEVVYEGRQRATSFVHGHLSAGRYYWRARGIHEAGEGPATRVRSFEVVLDDTPPALAVHFPEGDVPHGSVVLRGATEPGSVLFVGETRVPVDDGGRFEHELSLRQGYNFVVVQAVDKAGNTTFRSQKIVADSQKTKRSS